jgi:hypothetical protein|tara:strand:- start:21 stop:452 length:432 start_codon:yes stop_codon:yes gene_type:complete
MVKKTNKTHLFSTVLIGFFFCIALNSIAQQNSFKEIENTSYSIQNSGTIANTSDYVMAINAANFNHHRLRLQRNTITFEGGLSVILFSAKEIEAKGITAINPLDFPIAIENYNAPQFKLAANNHILEPKRTTSPKESFKFNNK